MDTPARFTLTTRYLGALPVVGHFAGRMGPHRLLDAWVPACDARLALDGGGDRGGGGEPGH